MVLNERIQVFSSSDVDFRNMSLKPIYNIVTEPVDDDLEEYTALEFFRACATNETLPTRLTVTNLGDFLLHADDSNHLITYLHNLLRDADSIERYSMIQFLVEGRLFNEEIVRLGIPSGRSSYVDIEIDELFIAPLEQESANQYIAPK